MQSSYDIIRSLVVKSSYLENKLGLTLYDYALNLKPKNIVEFGVLNGYSAIAFGLALKDLGRGHLTCYDLWEKYPYNHGDIKEVQQRIDDLGLASYVSLKYGDVYEWSVDPGSFDLLHIDVSNDGNRLRQILENLNKADINRGPILFEGGTRQRDKLGWSSNNENASITSLKKEIGYRVLDERFPGISVIEPAPTSVKIIQLDKHETPEGFMLPIYRNWDASLGGYEPKMIYATSINPNSSKGPILHRRKQGMITATKGTVCAEYMINGNMQRTYLRDHMGKSSLLIVPEGVPVRYINLSTSDEAILINAPSRAWLPEDPDTTKRNSWEEYGSDEVE